MEQCSGFPRYIIKKRNCYSAPRNSIKIKENDNINKTIQFQIQNSNKGIFFSLIHMTFFVTQSNVNKYL